MNIVMMASGTRGDIQPMIQLAIALQKHGYQIKMVVGSNFVKWVESFGIKTFPTIDIETLMNSELGIKWVESKNPVEQIHYMKKLTESILEQSVEDVLNSTMDADVLIGGFVSEPYLQAIQEKRNIPLITIALQPYRATMFGEACLVPIFPQSNSLINLWFGKLVNCITWSISRKATNMIRTRLGLNQHTYNSYINSIKNIPAIYAISQYMIPNFNESNIFKTGYIFLEEDYNPPENLIQFIENGNPPVYIGFGSMPSSNPEKMISLASDILKKFDRKGVMIRGWNKKINITIPENIFLLDNVSHAWLFPKMTAIVHHGGAGTTAAALRAGKPSLIIPHMADQPYWGRRIFELGLGVKPILRHKLNISNFTTGINKLLNDQKIKSKASGFGELIGTENGVEKATHKINSLIINSI